MNLIWLSDFLALAASGNFSRAAEERHTTQPAFSRRIRALEAWLGTELLDRRSQPAQLTEAGQWFRQRAQALLDEVERLPGEAQAVAGSSAATLRFAATHALSFTFLPAWLRGLEARTPVGPVRLVSDVLPHCEALLRQRQVQFVLSHAHAQAPGALDGDPHTWAVVGTDALLPVSAPGPRGKARHALPAGAPRREAARVPWLAYSAESGLGRLLRQWRGPALAELPLQPVFTAHLASALRPMALDGRGLAWLPASLIGDDLAAGRLVPAAPVDWQLPLEIRLYRHRETMGAAAEQFWQAASGEN